MRGLYISWLVHSLVLTVMVHLSTQTEHLNSTLDICRLFPDGTKIRKPGGCTDYIECKNHVRSTVSACDEKTPYFKLKTQKCDKSYDGSYCEPPCTTKTQGYIGDSINCARWYLCEGKKSMATGFCPTGQYFDKVTSACVYPKDTVCVATFELCDVAPLNVLFRDEYNCNKYFSCDKDFKLQTYTCDAGKYFNVATGSCVAKKEVVCDDHPVPDDVCGTKKLAFRNKFVSDQSTCRGYFYCRDLGSGIPDTNPTFLQCDEDHFFNQERQACIPRESQKCSQDRCDGRKDGEYEIAETRGCHEYYVCQDGRESETKSCEDKYFDVATRKCTDTVKTYGACSA